jgi:uncharacterized membrane protein YbhN (UPF0104 family)
LKPPEARRPRSLLRSNAPRIAGSVLLLAVLLYWLDPGEVVGHLRRLPPWVLAATLAPFLAIHCLGAVKLYLLLNIEPIGLGYREALRCHFWGLLANLVLPSSIGGDAVVAATAIRKASSRGRVLFGVLLHRLMDMAGLLALAVAGAALIWSGLDQGAQGLLMRVSAVAAAGAAAAAVVFLLFARRLPFKWRRRLVKARRLLRTLARQPARASASAAISIAGQAGFILLNAWLASRAGLSVPIAVWFFAWPLAKLSSALPFTQGGVGAREFALAGLLAPFGVSPGHAVAVSLLWQCVVILGGLSAGVAAFLLGGFWSPPWRDRH